MNITFIINNEDIVLNIDENETLYNIKNMLKDVYFKTCDKWLMFEFCGEKPIREHGKNDWIPGDIPLTMDRRKLCDFSVRDDIEYKFKVKEVAIEKKPVVNKQKSEMNKVRNLNNETRRCERTFDVTNDEQFPKLK